MTIPRKKPVILPKYLKKRKLELLRKKILLRKYAYLYYQKTISRILVSTTFKYYRRRILKKAFSKLKTNWFEQRIEWRLTVRSNIHYKFALKRKILYHWQYYLMLRKQKIVRMAIANLHYQNKIKTRYFVKLKYLKKFNLLHQNLTKQSSVHAIYLFLHINLITLAASFFTSKMEYVILILYYQKYRGRKLRDYLKKLQHYKQTQIVKKNHERLIKLFRKSKYNPENLRASFENWHTFTQISIIIRLKHKIAQTFLENKLKYLYFRRLYIYKELKRVKRKNEIVAEEFYRTSLKIHSFKRWIKFVIYKHTRNNNVNEANEFYRKKLKQKSFVKLLKYKYKKEKYRRIITDFREKIKQQVKRQCFDKLNKYFYHKQTKKLKYQSACTFHDNFLIKKIFTLLAMYVQDQRLRRLRLETLVNDKIKQRELQELRKILNNLIKYKDYKSAKRIKIQSANQKFKTNLLQKTFFTWKIFVNRNKMVAYKYEILNKRYCNTITKNAFSLWKNYVAEEKLYRTILSRAKDLYNKSLLREGIRIILLQASKEQKKRESVVVQNIEKKILIALKYFKIWKYRTKPFTETKNDQNFSLKVEINHKEIIHGRKLIQPATDDFLMDFEWDSLCFAAPRIPEYLKINND